VARNGPDEFALLGVGSGNDEGSEPWYPYEFELTTGGPVRLHDMALTHITVRLLLRELDLRFQYDDAFLPKGMEATPAIAMQFGGVAISRWECDVSMASSTGSELGQVSEFRWLPPRSFHLSTFLYEIEFEADRCQVEAMPSDAEDR
jgi:hypothetical protein